MLARLSGLTHPMRSVGAVLLSLAIVASAAQAPCRAEPSLEPPYELVINSVVDSALDDLLLQMLRLPAFASALASDPHEAVSASGKKDVVARPRIVIGVDHSVVDRTHQQSVASQLVDSVLLQTARQKLSRFEIVDAGPSVLDRVQYILGGRLNPLDTVVTTSRGTFRVDLLLTEFKTSQIVAQTSVRFEAKDVDLRPLGTGLTH